jgi:hypothetical protein
MMLTFELNAKNKIAVIVELAFPVLRCSFVSLVGD